MTVTALAVAVVVPGKLLV